MAGPIEETYWTAKEWASRTRIPYRAILKATASGDLRAVRPSGTAHGAILISESSWSAWIDRVQLRTRTRGHVTIEVQDGGNRSLSDLALT